MFAQRQSKAEIRVLQGRELKKANFAKKVKYAKVFKDYLQKMTKIEIRLN